MPRNKRIAIIGGIYHVIVRGIERKEIFRETKDRSEFISRLEINLKKTQSKVMGGVVR